MLPISMLYRGVRNNPNGEAVVDASRRLSYNELIQSVEAFAAYLKEVNPRPQSRIAICAFNNWEHVVAMMAVFASGNIWVPLNPRNSHSELTAIIGATNPGLIVVDESCLDKFDRGQHPLVLARCSGAAVGHVHLEAILSSHAGRKTELPIDPGNGLQAIKFTGGTTSAPKGVMQPYRAFVACAATMLSVFGFSNTDRMLAAAPLTHGAGTFLLPVMAGGGCTVLVDRAKSDVLADVMLQERITTSFMPPTLIYAMLDEVEHRGVKSPHLRQLIYGAAPMPVARIKMVTDLLGPCLGVIYGQTEAPSVIAAMSAAEMAETRNYGSVGRSTPFSRVEIVNPAGERCISGEVGEIVVTGDLVMRGYLDRDKLSQRTIVDGWLHTGDLGFFDERGYLFLKGRLSDVIITGGFNVYPADVEAALSRHSNVKDVVVFGRTDDYWGERVEAAVTLRVADRSCSDELIAFAKQHIGPIKAPKVVHIMPDFPKTAVGKVAKAHIREITALPDLTI